MDDSRAPESTDPALQRPRRRLARSIGPAGLIAGGILTVIVVMALIVPLTSLSEAKIDLSLRLASPSEAFHNGWIYILGGDQLGRSVLARVVFGARVSLMVGVLSATLAMIFGTALGVMAGLFRGVFEDVVMRIIDLWMGIPTLLVALVILYVTGPGVFKVVIVLAIMRWVVFARVARALTLSVREQPFFEVARALGCRSWRILWRHILPNIRWDIVIIATLEVARAMLSEAALSFLGLGVQPPASSWGTMLADSRAYITYTPWLVIFPGLAILTTTISMNVLTESVRKRRRAKATSWTQT